MTRGPAAAPDGLHRLILATSSHYSNTFVLRSFFWATLSAILPHQSSVAIFFHELLHVLLKVYGVIDRKDTSHLLAKDCKK